MKLALAQIKLSDDKKRNLDKALSFIEQASDCDLIVLPEMLMGKRTADNELFHMAEDVKDGEFATSLLAAAKEYNVSVCACLWEESGSELVYNTAMVYGASGNILAKYRKLHLFDALSVKESDHMLRGESLPPVFKCGDIVCGLSICYDLRFPEVYRSLVRRGADLFVIPAAWYAGVRKVEHLHTLLSARALENTSYCACANLCEDSFSGHSAAFAPFGEMAGSLNETEGLVKVDINISYIKHIRAALPCLENFRDDIL